MAKRKKKKLRKIWVISIIVLIIAVFAGIKINNIVMEKVLNDNLKISYDNTANDDGKYKVTITYGETDGVECSIDNNDFKPISECIFELPEGNYTIYIRKNNNVISKKFDVKDKYDGKFSTTIDVLDKYYLALNGKKTLEYTFNYPEGYDTSRTYSIEDESIISMENDTIKGLKVGSTNLTVSLKDGNSKTYEIVVTDLIVPATVNNNKGYLPCKQYTEIEAHMLDDILASRVLEAGNGTRGGVIAAARFMVLEFPYSIRYFNENGRLVDHGIRPHIDAEGRYYHKGLYLSEDKFQYLEKGAKSTGPQIWGCYLYDYFISKQNMNGFTCSGFVTWAMLNGGFDVGDVGAGDFKQFDDDLSDLGPHHEITDDYVRTGNYKVGDFIARDGHAALIIGINEDTVYTAESLPPKLKVYIYGRYASITKHGGTWKSLVNDDNLTYVVEMGGIYPNGDGWYHDMWE